MNQTPDGALVVTVPPERLALAEKAHRSVTRTMFIIFGVLVAVILGAGIPLSNIGRTSLIGILIIAAVFLAFPFLVAWSNSRTLAKAKAFVSRDGSTQVVVDPQGVRIADTFIPFERITYAAATISGEQYSMGGIPGELMAWRIGAIDSRPGFSRVGGAMAGTALRKKLYRDGAKSTISLAIGVDRRSTISAPEGFIDQLKTLPKRGEEPGRVDMPFGAFLNAQEIEYVLGVMHHFTQGRMFPTGFVSGDWNWASVTTAAGETRQKIQAQFAELFAKK